MASLCRYKYGEDANTQVLELKHHQDACRALLFAPDGQSTCHLLLVSVYLAGDSLADDA